MLTSFFAPQWIVESVLELDVPALRARGLEALLLDVDCTLKRYREESVSQEVAEWIERLREGGIKLCLISNGLGPRIERFAASVRLPFVAKALKPFPCGCRRGMRAMGVLPAHTAIVGDQLFADILAGRWAGIATILVRPIHPEDEAWFTRLKRPAERWILRRIGPPGRS